MRVLVMGAGAIGCLIGGRLAAAGNDVLLVGRQSLVDAVKSRGLVVEEGGRVHRSRSAEAVASLRDIPPDGRHFDAAFMTVKVHDTREASRDLLPVLGPNVAVALVQNGVGGDDIAAAVLGSARLVSAVVTLAVSVVEPGHVRQTTSSGGIGLAAVGSTQPEAPFEPLLRQAGYVVRCYGDYRAMKWSKLLLNIVGNASSAILDMPPAEIFSNDDLLGVEIAAFREGASVMRASGHRPVPLPGYPVPLFTWAMRRLPLAGLRPLFRRLGGDGRGSKMPSLHIDLSGGRRRSEVEYLNGAIVAAANALGMRVPVNEVLHSILSGIVSGETSWEEYRGKPEALLGRLHS